MTPGARWALFSREDIPDARDPSRTYLTRWRLLQTPWFGVYLHAIREPDGDRDLHDHPWSFLSLVLRGGYVEARPHAKPCPPWCDGVGYVQRGPFSLAFRRAEDLHRIAALLRQPTWTLLLVGPRRRKWGFVVGTRWVPYDVYLRRGG